MFDIGLLEFATMAVVALLVFGPDRLPKVTAQATHWLRQIREQAQSARQQLTDSVDVDTSMLKDLADLHPRNIARSVMEPIDEARSAVQDAGRGATDSFPGVSPDTRAAKPAAPPAPAPFDPDAT